MARDVYEIFYDLTELDFDEFLEKVKKESDTIRMREIASTILRNIGGNHRNENDYLYNIRAMVEFSLDCDCCLIIHGPSEFHMMGDLPKHTQLTTRGGEGLYDE